MSLVTTFEHALAEGGLAWLYNEKGWYEPLIENFTVDALNQVVTAFANNLPSGGIKNEEWGPIRGAILKSIPDIDGITREKIEQLVDALIAQAQNASRQSTQ